MSLGIARGQRTLVGWTIYQNVAIGTAFARDKAQYKEQGVVSTTRSTGESVSITALIQ